MMRMFAALIAVFCVGTVLTESLAVGVLWYRGNLTLETLQNVRDALSGAAGAETASVHEHSGAPAVDDVIRERAERVLEIKGRESELGLLKDMVAETATRLGKQKQDVEQKRAEFERRLRELDEQVSAEAVEQARGVLLAMPPDAAVDYLMSLSAEENLLLLKGMPEKSIAKILQAFAGDQPKLDRARELFEALSRGEPKKNWIDTNIQDIQKRAGQAASG